MYIDEIYIRLLNNECFEFKEEQIINFNCSKCGRVLLEISLKDDKVQYNSPQEYLYYDGDSVNIPEKYWLKVDTGMMFGSCENCGKQIALIHANVLDKNIDNNVLSEESFMICNEDDMIKDFAQVKQYAIFLNHIVIGKVIVYKAAIINKNAVHWLLEDIERNVALASLECVSEDESMKISDLGICNGHYRNENQFNVWQKSSLIVEKLATSLVELLK
ncbi:hypothetical protein [uncultured Clostridium sp.]|uniref:hypothetical protein n=1 Tax=uncultured Clostridium sp. TaxID=59620 RepID=UPI0028E5AF55|nr:hypothetical protein [uncultured Clostridium sp.]